MYAYGTATSALVTSSFRSKSTKKVKKVKKLYFAELEHEQNLGMGFCLLFNVSGEVYGVSTMVNGVHLIAKRKLR